MIVPPPIFAGEAILKIGLSAAVVAIALAAAPAAYANPSIWVQCDGQPRPEGALTTAARLGAIIFIPIIGLAAAGEAGTGTPAAVGQAGVDACTEALADPSLPNFWQRHMNILRARAIHYVEVGDHDAALADLVTMREVAAGRTDSPLIDRSIGVSALLLEAALRARNSEYDRAKELAITAADARPYSLPIQQLARTFYSGDSLMSADEQRLFGRVLSYDPTLALRYPIRLDQTDDAAAAADAWEVALAAGDHVTTRGLDERIGWTQADGPDGFTLVRAAIAMARAGRTARAEELAARAEEKLGPETSGDRASGGIEGVETVEEQAPAAASGSRAALEASRRAQLRQRVEAQVAENAAPFRPLLRAWLAALRGDEAQALSIMQSNFERLPKVMAGADLLQRLRQNPALREQVPDFLIQSAISGARPEVATVLRGLDLDDLIRGLPQYERVDGNARYRPGSNIGYRETALASGGTRITYSGATFYASSEMMLLRAGELAQAQGRDSFLVLDVNRTTLDIIPLESAAPAAAYAARSSRFLPAGEVVRGLMPIYVELPMAIESERRGRRR